LSEFNITSKDYHTTTQPGASATWGYLCPHDILYNEEFILFLKNGFMEFTLFDDTVTFLPDEATMKKGGDVIGYARY